MRQGFLFAVLAALVWGLAPVFAKVGLAKASPSAGLAVRSIAVTAVILATIIFSGQWRVFTTLGTRPIFMLAIEGLLGGLIGQYFYFKALKYLDASTVVPAVGSYPLFAFIFAIIILSEKVTVAKSLGVLLVVSGIFLLGL